MSTTGVKGKKIAGHGGSRGNQYAKIKDDNLGTLEELGLSTQNSRKTLMQTDRQKILAALDEKPLQTFEVIKRVNIKNQDDCQSLLLKMRDDGAVRFDIHKGIWVLA